ncbi:response regulator [Pontibacterium sp.]|uniref:response regulator n=1 Tax=Pontibacterium sp. TaxID=2036026 RepID=UPI00356973F7
MRTLTTGDIAKYCDVNQRTVIRWLDKGVLKGFKLPGRGNNRVKLDDFVSFLKKNGMPIPDELAKEGQPKVLVVDDELAIANAIRRTLKPLDVSIDIANGGFEAGSQLMLLKPDLMTLDLSMPGMNGFDVIKFVRSTEEIANTQILVISALNEIELGKAIEMGANGALSKPFDNDVLRRTVSDLLSIAVQKS